MLNSDMREAREGEINIRGMNSNTLSSMIHYIYTGELADGWQELDVEDMTIATDMYDLPGWAWAWAWAWALGNLVFNSDNIFK